MADISDDFPPLSMTGISSKPVTNHISLSQLSTGSRLSKSFRRRNANSSFAASSIGSTVDINVKTCTNPNQVEFCPTCHAPFDIMTVSPAVHAHQCSVDWSELDECPKGEYCYSDNIFHYRDYAHRVLAHIRSKWHLPSHASPSTSLSKTSPPFKSPKCLSLTKKRESLQNRRNGELSATKKVLFSDCESIVSISSSSSKPAPSICINNTASVEYNEEKPNKDQNHNLQKGSIVYGPEISDKIKNITDKDNVDKTPRTKRKSEQIHSSPIPKKINQDVPYSPCKERSMKKINENTVTILDTINPDVIPVETNDCCDCNISKKVGVGMVQECKNCKKKNFKVDHEVVETEVRATMSVVVSPTSEDLDCDKPETPVKVDASCNKSGWRTIEIAAPQSTDVKNVTVSVCKCMKTMSVNCSLAQNHTVVDLADDETENKDLQVKFFSHVKEPKQMNKLNGKTISPEHANHQMSITSYFKASKQPSTLTLKTSIEGEVASGESSSKEPIPSGCMNNDLTAQSTSKPSNESAIASWKQIMKGLVQKGQDTLCVTTDDSEALTSSSSTSAGSWRTYRSSKKTCPFYKKIPDTSFVVDAFQYGIIPGITHYFLSHFHYDHYGGLKKSFCKPIYCSKITAALVKMKLRVDEMYVHELELDCPRKICGVLVTALDANHCPGSVMFLFQLQDGRNFLHVGDFRADPKMESYPCFWNLAIDKLFLDTTYCEPRYDFPMQSETIAKVVELAMEHYLRSKTTLFVCGSYTIGKERVFTGIAEALGCKLWAPPDKRKVLACIGSPAINDKLTAKQQEAQVHVCRMNDLNYTFLTRYLKQHAGIFTHLVAFIPTGWELKRGHDINVTSYEKITIYGVPYSEHSSFSELKRFVKFLKPLEIIPTVNVDLPAKRTAMQRHFQQWLSSPLPEVKNKQVQQKMGQYLSNSKSKGS